MAGCWCCLQACLRWNKRSVCVCVFAVHTADYMKGWSVFHTIGPFLKQLHGLFSHLLVCKATLLWGFHSQVSPSKITHPYDVCELVVGALRPHHTNTVRTGRTLWKRLCFIEIQQTSTGCFAGLGNRNGAWMLLQNKYPWLLFSFNPTDSRDTSRLRTKLRTASFWATSWLKKTRICGVQGEMKTSWCSKSVWVQKCWYVKLKSSTPRVLEDLKQYSGLFLCPGVLFDRSSSRRSRTSVMKQGWPQLPLKRHSEHLVFPKVMAGSRKPFSENAENQTFLIFLPPKAHKRLSSMIWLLSTCELKESDLKT